MKLAPATSSTRIVKRLGIPESVLKAVTVLGKHRVPPLLENLQHSLLNQSVDDARHAGFSDPAVRLRDFDPFDRCG